VNPVETGMLIAMAPVFMETVLELMIGMFELRITAGRIMIRVKTTKNNISIINGFFVGEFEHIFV
jgi:hypothetical protein